MNIPDLSEKVLGFRRFSLTGGELGSTGVQTRWVPGENHARCLARKYARANQNQGLWFSALSFSNVEPYKEPKLPDRHDAPAPGCECGLYGLHAMPDEWIDGDAIDAGWGIAGAIAGWGRVEVHRTGFRAEHAEVLILAYEPLSGLKRMKRVEKAARTYGVPAVPLMELDVEARKLASPVPPSQFPDLPEPSEEVEKTPAVQSSWPILYAPFFGDVGATAPETPPQAPVPSKRLFPWSRK